MQFVRVVVILTLPICLVIYCYYLNKMHVMAPFANIKIGVTSMEVSKQQCEIPQLNPFDLSIRKFIKKPVGKMACSLKQLGVIKNGRLFFPVIKNIIRVYFQYIRFVNDFKISLSPPLFMTEKKEQDLGTVILFLKGILKIYVIFTTSLIKMIISCVLMVCWQQNFVKRFQVEFNMNFVKIKSEKYQVIIKQMVVAEQFS